MNRLGMTALFLLCLLLASCTGTGIVSHNGTELTPEEQASMYESREQEHPTPDLPDKGTVYWSPSGSKYHRDPDCGYLKNASKIYQGTPMEAANHGADSPCARCAGGNS